ncbi:putative galacturonokinase-like isoform 2 [Capsicum annuum]|nr:putative galacturonokinase-like isoform 2 [Capsicum annuum]
MEVATPVTMVVVVVVSEECVDVDDMLVLDKIRNKVAELSGRDAQEGGSVSAMTINKGILLGFVPSNDSQPETKLSVDRLPGDSGAEMELRLLWTEGSDRRLGAAAAGDRAAGADRAAAEDQASAVGLLYPAGAGGEEGGGDGLELAVGDGGRRGAATGTGGRVGSGPKVGNGDGGRGPGGGRERERAVSAATEVGAWDRGSGPEVTLQSAQFEGEVLFRQEFIPHILKLHRVDEVQLPKHMSETNGLTEQIDLSTPQEECKWGNYARGAIYALQSRGNHLKTVSKISFAAG